ncbi:hypothetical protein K432DRAFT_406761 [Lepidopterella palustris CBS 459.81]|uniref:CorA-like transporter domain-containing protein n=1 Tax=Lepidopterella palustris CBS 459.81 TaxID=1314670 RepID=A0A8E2E6J3_9PEZI|nr:hypothetical protein K432DRAFT_406761 [Lepidopterella palustris CBS 459.81]
MGAPTAAVVTPQATQAFDAFSSLVGAEHYWPRLEFRQCCASGTAVDVKLIDIVVAAQNATTSPSTLRTEQFKDLGNLETYLNDKSHGDFQTRIFSIHQKNSWRPLGITGLMLRKVFDTHDIMPEFLEIVLSFGRKTCAIEEAFSGSVFRRRRGNVTEIAYIFKYPERKEKTDGGDPWSIRQTGVYHRHDMTKNHSIWILLHPVPDSAGERGLTELLKIPHSRPSLLQNPLLIHGLLFSTYIHKWRDYMTYYEEKLLPLSNTTMSTWINEPLRLNHQTLTTVRFLENRFLPLAGIFASFSNVITALRNLNTELEQASVVSKSDGDAMVQLLENYQGQTAAYIENARFLQKRSGGTAQLISDTLAFKNSDVAQVQSGYMLKLTLSTVDDSATVRVVTIVTLIYLPFAFMGTVLGMNFFQMNSSHNLVVSPQFWIYFAISVPMTLATIAYWRWMKWRKDVAREKAAALNSARNLNEKL